MYGRQELHRVQMPPLTLGRMIIKTALLAALWARGLLADVLNVNINSQFVNAQIDLIHFPILIQSQ